MSRKSKAGSCSVGGRPALVAVAHRGLVAVMAVGDEDGAGCGGRDEHACRRALALVGHDPQAVADAVIVRDVRDGRPAAVIAASAAAADRVASSYRPTTGEVLSPVARRSR